MTAELVNSNDTEGVLLETVFADKKTLGKGPQFERGSLMYGPVRSGLRGLIANQEFKPGQPVISISISRGCLTPRRATIECATVLNRLGPLASQLDDYFVLTLALYQRYQQANGPEYDLLFSTITSIDYHLTTPGSVLPFTESLLLSGSNDQNDVYYAEQREQAVRTLDIDRSLFGALYSVVRSRQWGNTGTPIPVGLVPGLDLANAAFGADANLACVTNQDTIKLIAVKNITKGQELSWNYNQADALNTWIAYGYLDPKRAYSALLEVNLDQAHYEKLIRLGTSNFHFEASQLSGPNSIEPKRLSFFLPVAGPSNTNSSEIQQAIQNALQAYRSLRVLFRMFVIASDNPDPSLIPSNTELQYEFTRLGFGYEARVIDYFLAALEQGGQRTDQIGKTMKESQLGAHVDLAPMFSIQTHAQGQWKRALELLRSLCLADDPTTWFESLSKHFDHPVSQDNLFEFLKEQSIQNPTIALFLVREHLACRLGE